MQNAKKIEKPDTENEIRVIIEDGSGHRVEGGIPLDRQICEVAAEFFEYRNWSTTDSLGRGQRAVVEIVDPNNPGRTRRLRGEQTIRDSGLMEGVTLRIFPESIAGIVDERERLRALVRDHRDMDELAAWNSAVSFEANKTHAPTRYTVTFHCQGFHALASDGVTPKISNEHRAEITLGAEYPRSAPFVHWLTPSFHPNIRPETGDVCLGVLMDRYLPGLGLSRLVTMLLEMVQYRNFDMTSALNKAAADWAMNPENWKYIESIGGSPLQGPVQEIFKQLKENRDGKPAPICFRPLTGGIPS